jgi:hypothetical protein
MEIFSDFYNDFKYLFMQDYFVADKEFVSRFLSQLYCRIYIPNQKMIKKGEKFAEIYMVHDGTVSLRLNRESSEFFLLPKGSMIGDYQILLGLRAVEEYISSDNSDTYTMCLSKKVFLGLLDQFPNAKEYYMMRAKARRIEFKRLRKQYKAEFDVGSDGEEEKIFHNPESFGKDYKFQEYKEAQEVTHLNDPDFFFNKDTTTYLNEMALEEVSEDEKPHEAFKDGKKKKSKEATNKLIRYYDTWIEEA